MPNPPLQRSTRTVAGPTVQVGDVTATPLARTQAWRIDLTRVAFGAFSGRPVAVDVARGDGSTERIPIPDPQQRVEQLLQAITIAAWAVVLVRWFQRKRA